MSLVSLVACDKLGPYEILSKLGKRRHGRGLPRAMGDLTVRSQSTRKCWKNGRRKIEILLQPLRSIDSSRPALEESIAAEQE